MDEVKILKLLNFLNKEKGLPLDSLAEKITKFEEQYYYPVQLQDKRIAMQSNFKALCEFYATASLSKEVSANDIWQEAKQKTEEMFSDGFFKTKEQADIETGKKYEDMTPEEKAVVDERNRKVNLINKIIENRSEEWIKKVYEKSKKTKNN